MHEVFYSGGREMLTEDGTFITGQMYAERYRPKHPPTLPPVVMVHGTGQSGSGFITNLAGAPGWAHDFVTAGHETVVVDQVGRGRSGTDPRQYGRADPMPLHDVDSLFARTKRYQRFPDSDRHTRWPDDDSTFNRFSASQLPSLVDRRLAEELNVPALEQLLLDIGPAILVTHSQASTFGFGVTDRRPELVLAHVTVEPNGPPFFDLSYTPGQWDVPLPGPERPFGITRLPLTFDPPLPLGKTLQPVRNKNTVRGEIQGWLQEEPARTLTRLASTPTAIVTADASFRTRVDAATSRFLTQAGVNHEHIQLSHHGITGNGHMMMLEPNSSEIAQIIIRWIHRTLTQ
jgi:pimeloyl-ACP methyl ester carboxylesterase